MSQKSVKIVIESKPKSHLVAIYTKLSIQELDHKFNELTGEYLLFPRYCSFKGEDGKTKYADRIVAVITDRAYRSLSVHDLVGKTSQDGKLFTVNEYHIKKDGVIRSNLLPNPELKQGKNLFVAVPTGIGYSEALSALTEIISTCREHGLLTHPCDVIIPGGDKVTGQHNSRAIIKPRDITTMEERVSLYVILRNLDWGYNGKDDQPYLIRCEWAKDEKSFEVILNPTKGTAGKPSKESRPVKAVEVDQSEDVQSEQSCSSASSVESVPSFRSVLVKSFEIDLKKEAEEQTKPSDTKTVEEVEKDIFSTAQNRQMTDFNAFTNQVSSDHSAPPMMQQMADPVIMFQEQILKAKIDMDEAYKRMVYATQEFENAKHRYIQISFSTYHPPAPHVVQHFMLPVNVESSAFPQTNPPQQSVQEHRVLKIKTKQEVRPEQATFQQSSVQA